MFKVVFASVAWLLPVRADIAKDLVQELPGFPPAASWGFKAYSGLLEVPGPVCGYDALRIHYQFHTSQSDPSKDPVAIWHQGGPGGSSIDTGLYGEMGAFQVGDKVHGNYLNPYAWNKVANMLYLESPAGSGGSDGFSQCIQGGKVVACHWNDKTQAEAYSHTLLAFFAGFPEYAKNDFYLTGESYFGQYGPNIAHFILNHEPFKTKINLVGIAAGNACWGGTESCVACNGPSSSRLDVENYFGKALFSPRLKAQIDKECDFATSYSGGGSGPFACDSDHKLSEKCHQLLSEMRKQVGPHNVYDIYDNCPNTQQYLATVGRDMHWLTNELRQGLTNPAATREALLNISGGYTWDCGGNVAGWIKSAEVKKALHLDQEEGSGSGFSYDSSGPASITLWPELATKLRVLIYNGDADACVPWVGNEDWVFGLETQGVLKETAPWSPWFTSNKASPAGYITKFQSSNAQLDFAFATIRLAGHMAPTFMPDASLVMFSTFLKSPAAAAAAELEPEARKQPGSEGGDGFLSIL
mmetsp:Transcript_50796/g.120696  ORF Transcript_50796/g.120696 Transcript_50796/m.120696 type:complete len:527 (-) Transcript_50796:177-1757(-)